MTLPFKEIILAPGEGNQLTFLFEDAPMGLTRNCAVGAIHELPLRE